MPALPPLGLSWPELVLVLSTVTFGTAVQGTVGFGLGLIAAPVLAGIDPMFVPGPILAVAILLGFLLTRRELKHVDRTGFGWVVLGRIPGTVAAIVTMSMLPQSGIIITIGALVLLAVAISVSGLDFELTPRTLVGTGAASGFMSTISSVGGPPLALAYQHSHGPRLRGTLSAHFIIGAGISVIALVAAGRYGAREVEASLVLVPAVLVGYLLSGFTAPILDRGYTRPVVLGLAALAGGFIIVRELL